ncbi:hypothetical protein F5Y15DRAFT_235234 [Xylariaceae sp. FL0016]|nr:hypothetical protein F5Y15DRAFT_235234 [Xylariaceae sp. FL0016]
MSRRAPPSSSGMAHGQNRQNEYFVPRDGIDREVITADICRYLGNDALVRPGNYENPQTGQIIQGYYINAYRNLTTAMIEDLKADSARWDQERRQQSASRSNTGGGTVASNGVVLIRSSNSPVVQYRNSDTHNQRQFMGPTEAGQYVPADTSRDYYGDSSSTPRYPGTGSAGYSGASNASYPAQQYGSQVSYQQGYSSAQQFQSPTGVSSHAGGSSMSGSFASPVQDPPYTIVGADSRVRVPDTYRDPRIADPRDVRDARVPATTMSSSRTTYATSGGPSSQGYYQNAPSQPYSSGAAQPVDPFYGRASPAGATPYTTAQAPQQQYESAPSRLSATVSSTQHQSSSGSSRHRDRDSVDRHGDSRHGHRSHRSGR